ncbi:MAG: secretin and TonB N-terminal domain-containing protein [Candidatus Omnitrophica bacterium]|nr:secretin and TonB N-terminal domain-containing protein [Candidatus Omnitrophota bacterium]
MNTRRFFIGCGICGSVFLFCGSCGAAIDAPAVAGTNAAAAKEVFDLDARNLNILDVLNSLGDLAQVNIVASRNVQGRVTAKLQKVTLEEALDAILDTNNFIYKREGGIIKVYAPQDLMQQEQTVALVNRVFSLKNVKANDMRQVLNSIKSPRGRVEINAASNQVILTDNQEIIKQVEALIADLDRQLETRIFRLNYGIATEMQSKLVEMIPKPEGEVFIDERTNSLVVRAVPEAIAKVEQMITTWDRRALQVLIEAKIYEVSLDHSRGLGLSFEYKEAEGNSDAVNIATNLPLGLASGGTFKIGTLTKDEYTVAIQALEGKTDSNILSNPRIVVANNKEANILVGSSEPYQVIYTDKETKTETQETRFIDVGVKLVVTPQISEDDYVTLKIHPEVSSARRVAEVNNALAVDTTQADTTVVVKNGRTIVLGGLIKDTDSETIAKIPILGDIPVIGMAFRSKLKKKAKKEVIVFITPHILKTEAESQNAPTRLGVNREDAMHNALREAEYRWRVMEEREHEQMQKNSR